MDSSQLFKDEYLTGNLNARGVDVCARIIGTLAMAIISIVGFSITMSSIAKNAVNGLYAVFPKFWDKVYEAHQAKLMGGGNQGMQMQQGGMRGISGILRGGANGGGIGMMVLGCFPNVKAVTDFSDGILDAKAYFLKAVPLCVVQVFIGVFIFFGYTGKVAQACAEFGTGLFDVVLTNVDPTAWVEALPTKMVVLDLATDGSPIDHDKVVNKVTRDAYSTYLGFCNDVEKEKRVMLARDIESWVMGVLEPYTTYTDSDKYKYTLFTAVVKGAPDLSRADEAKGKGTFSVAKSTPIDIWTDISGTAIDVSDMYLVVRLQFTRIASHGTSTQSVQSTAQIPKSNASVDTSKGIITIPMPEGAEFSVPSGSSGGLTLSDGSVINVKFSTTSGNLLITAAKKSDNEKMTTDCSIKNISGLYYKVDTSHPISGIEFASGLSTITFKPSNNAISEWTWGGKPEEADDEEQPTSSSSTNDTDLGL